MAKSSGRKRVKLPRTLRDRLLPLEIALYEEHTDDFTRSLLTQLRAWEKELSSSSSRDHRADGLKKAAWIILRCSHLRLALARKEYPPCIKEGIPSALQDLCGQLRELDDDVKAVVDRLLPPLDGGSWLTPGQVDRKVRKFLKSAREALHRVEKAAAGGTDRARFKYLRRLEKRDD